MRQQNSLGNIVYLIVSEDISMHTIIKSFPSRVEVFISKSASLLSEPKPVYAQNAMLSDFIAISVPLLHHA